jgi:hypothetical protein
LFALLNAELFQQTLAQRLAFDKDVAKIAGFGASRLERQLRQIVV